jgi:hypothetical protein
MMTPLWSQVLKFSRRPRSETEPLNKKAARERAKRTPVTPNVPGRSSRSVGCSTCRAARVLAVFPSNPLIPLACVDVSSQHHDGDG